MRAHYGLNPDPQARAVRPGVARLLRLAEQVVQRGAGRRQQPARVPQHPEARAHVPAAQALPQHLSAVRVLRVSSRDAPLGTAVQ